MITVEEQQTVLKPIVETITDLKTVFTDFPDAIQRAQLPCLVLSAGEAEYMVTAASSIQGVALETFAAGSGYMQILLMPFSSVIADNTP